MRVGDGSSFASGDEEIRVGIDLVSVAEIQASITRFGARYSERVFTDHERASAKGDDRTFASSLAARFAAKEATMKVLRPSSADSIPWTAIEVRTAENGACSLALHGLAEELAVTAKLGQFALSMSHQGDMAVAIVLARKRP